VPTICPVAGWWAHFRLRSSGYGGQVALPTLQTTDRRHTFSNGTSIFGRRSSHSGTGKFFERMNAGLYSFDW
jgi:hypothetical protein